MSSPPRQSFQLRRFPLSSILSIPPKAFYGGIEVNVLEFCPDGKVVIRVVNPNQNLVVQMDDHSIVITPHAVVPSSCITVAVVGVM